MFTRRDLALIRAALKFFDEEMSPSDLKTSRPYFTEKLRQDLTSQEVRDLRNRLGTCRLRYLCCNDSATLALSTELTDRHAKARSQASAVDGRVVTVLVISDA